MSKMMYFDEINTQIKKKQQLLQSYKEGTTIAGDWPVVHSQYTLSRIVYMPRRILDIYSYVTSQGKRVIRRILAQIKFLIIPSK